MYSSPRESTHQQQDTASQQPGTLRGRSQMSKFTKSRLPVHGRSYIAPKFNFCPKHMSHEQVYQFIFLSRSKISKTECIRKHCKHNLIHGSPAILGVHNSSRRKA
uniref:Uncharacterized protein n=1 Tax=Sphaerodactylus townsendi TaxID=933632 RepID=A0ACB8F112_9SAUR